MEKFAFGNRMRIWRFLIIPIRGLPFTASAFRVACRRNLMNLTIDPWIPIVWLNGRSGIVSLSDAYARGEEIRDLAVRPHERIAVMRLLICIAQVALDGPANRDDWKACQWKIAAAAVVYLKH